MDLYSIVGSQLSVAEPLPPETAPGAAALPLCAQPSGAEPVPNSNRPVADVSPRGSGTVPTDFEANGHASVEADLRHVEADAADPVGPSHEEYSLAVRLLAEDKLSALLTTIVERIRYITNASGIALALCENEDDAMVCHASSGPAAPEAGARMYIRSGITAESLRTRQTLRCDRASTDSRVNQESCKALGIESVMVVPVLLNRNVVGMFQLFSARPVAFSERDATALRAALPQVEAGLLEAVNAGVPIGRIPWAEELVVETQAPVELEQEPRNENAVLENAVLENEDAAREEGPALADESGRPRIPAPNAAVPIDSFRKPGAPASEPGSAQPEVPAFLARLADEARPAAQRTWSQWFRPQW